MKKLIKVTKEDIKEGARRIEANLAPDGPKHATCSMCPIAVAMNRQGLRGVEVYFTKWGWAGRGKFNLPRSAQRFISKFDETHTGKPFNFYINY